MKRFATLTASLMLTVLVAVFAAQRGPVPAQNGGLAYFRIQGPTVVIEYGDNSLSPVEQRAYARRVVESLSLQVDGQRRDLTLDGFNYSEFDAMKHGEGSIRLRLHADIPSIGAGAHRLEFNNAHASDIGVYLVNALVPNDDRVRITGQLRDELQRRFDLEYMLSKSSHIDLASAFPYTLSLALAFGFLAVMKRSARAEGQSAQ